MGQYHVIVNLDRQECILPRAMDSGWKAWEQVANLPSTPQALFILLMCSNGRGGGDFRTAEPPGESIYGRWTGDRIAVVGDYAEDRDLRGPLHHPAGRLWELCANGTYRDVAPLVKPILDAELAGLFVSDKEA